MSTSVLELTARQPAVFASLLAQPIQERTAFPSGRYDPRLQRYVETVTGRPAFHRGDGPQAATGCTVTGSCQTTSTSQGQDADAQDHTDTDTD